MQAKAYTPRNIPRRIVIGVDTHLNTIHLATLTKTGQPLGDAKFRTTQPTVTERANLTRLDADSTTHAVLASHGLTVRKDPTTDTPKAVLITHCGTAKTHTTAIQQIKNLLVTAPAEL